MPTRFSGLVGGLVGFGAAVVLLSTTLGGPAPLDDAAETPEAAINPLPEGDGPASGTPVIGVGPEWNVLNWGPGPRAAVPASFGYDTVVDGRTEQRIFVSTQANDDVAAADSIVNMSVSDDSGLSFLTTQRNYPTTALNMTRLPDGSLFAVDFIPEWADATRTSVNLLSWRSADGGQTWERIKGRFTPPAGDQFAGTDRGLRVHRVPRVLADGAIVVPVYTVYRSAPRRVSAFLQSTDGGLTWTQRSVVPSSIGTNEVGWGYAKDGRLIAVMRTEGETPARLRVSWSGDDGRTWSPSQPLLDPAGQQVVGIYPDVVLQPNGIMLLSTGRPDNRVYVDYDGTGETWDEFRDVFTLYPSDTGNGRYDGSSGNQSMTSVGSSRTLFFGDKCHVWGCKAYNEQYGVVTVLLNAVTGGVGRIDVASQLAAGVATVTGDFAPADPRFPEQRPEGAFDGSSRPHSAAVLAGSANPAMTLRLDRPYAIDRIGLMLGSGQPLDASVQLSLDGRRWSRPVVRTTGTRDHSMRYTEFAAQQAQYVRVMAPAGTTPVTELEIHAADLQTFENDPGYGIPRGFVDARNATVTDQEVKGWNSSSSLRLFDKFLDDNATATKPADPVAHQRATFAWSTNDFRGPFTFAAEGHAGDDAVTPWRFRLVPGATASTPPSLEVSDGSAWASLGQLSAVVPVSTWVPITVDTTTSRATVTIGAQEFTTDVTAEPADRLAGLTFTTGDPIGYGMSFFIDDLSIGEIS
ncbi:sialidase family protein [Jiangella alba]|uniref:BNR repeat-like domain-containing protein n=1 Tax=Jiangella alba TaxID=561176 RepID=A0A1H5MHK4_9ACTN|nr:sialidase family protein [Jiangella alba]SEE88187.1 BNR repeat-like domain-containing protein [Jiangella alba]